ncbi:hypothetical protein [uncultured Umboniibacter sp.]|uniref:hypothetical protein n=1 Tax=uncultured Umboniibacter sp. TaxID=1798917 RepID=UPI00261B99F9|nr:hypothetical protein [uncultured Umboniibacter sp.]
MTKRKYDTSKYEPNNIADYLPTRDDRSMLRSAINRHALGSNLLSPAELASCCHHLFHGYSATSDRLSHGVGISAGHLRHLACIGRQLSNSALRKLDNGSLSVSKARLIAKLPHTEQNEWLAKLNYSFRRLRSEIDGSDPTPVFTEDTSADFSIPAEAISHQVGVATRIEGDTATQGRIILSFDNLDTFDYLMTRLEVDLREQD